MRGMGMGSRNDMCRCPTPLPHFLLMERPWNYSIWYIWRDASYTLGHQKQSNFIQSNLNSQKGACVTAWWILYHVTISCKGPIEWYLLKFCKILWNQANIQSVSIKGNETSTKSPVALILLPLYNGVTPFRQIKILVQVWKPVSDKICIFFFFFWYSTVCKLKYSETSHCGHLLNTDTHYYGQFSWSCSKHF